MHRVKPLHIYRLICVFVTNALFLYFPPVLRAEGKPSEAELIRTRGARDVIWSFDASVIRHDFNLPDNSAIAGVAGSFTAGYGKINEGSWIMGRISLLAGPWETARDGAFDADYVGTGVDIEYGTAFPGTSLRSGSAPILAINAGYLDLGGRNIGANKKSNSDPNDKSNYYLEQEFKASFGAVVVTPSIGWSWAKPERPKGNEAELLVTRVESSFLKLGLTVPVYSRSRVEVIKRADADGINQGPTRFTSTGMVRGYCIVASAGVWLGI